MSKVIAYILSPVLFYIGDLFSKAPAWLPEWIGFPLAVIYQKCMAGSIIIEEWAEKDIMWTRNE